MARPDPTEYAPQYDEYIAHVPEDDIVSAMNSSLARTLAFLTGIPDTEAGILHPPYTSTIKQVVGHLSDCERISGYRALRFARGDSAPLPSFDENMYAQTAQHDRISLSDLVSEFENLRRSHIAFFEQLTEEAWLRRGVGGDDEMSVRALAYAIVGHERHHVAIIRKRLSAG